MSTLRSPEDVAASVLPMPVGAMSHAQRSIHESRLLLIEPTVSARDAEIAAWCEDKAGEADREAEAHPDRERVARCEGQAVAFRALATLLGSPAVPS